MGKDPHDVRQEIEATRERMADTVDELGHRADVKGRVAGYVAEKKDAVVSGVSGVLPDGEAVASGGDRIGRTAKENPIGLAIGGAAIGFLVGMLAPASRMEDERVGELSDELKQRARETGQEAIEAGKEVVSEATESAVETAKETASEQADRVSSTAQGHAQDMSPEGGSPARP